MFRCITELKGIAIDVDSFDESLSIWNEITENYQCVFITSDENTKNALILKYGEKSVVFVNSFTKYFLPNGKMHITIINMLGLETSEFAYLSTSYNFMSNALAFLSSTIWVTQNITYKDLSISPDLICTSFNDLFNYLSSRTYGFYGEASIDPEHYGRGIIIPIKLETETSPLTLIVLGRYFSSSHYMSNLHPYSSAIFLNKYEGKKSYGVFTKRFSTIYSTAIKNMLSSIKIDAVLNVPCRIGKPNRFKAIVEKIAMDNQLIDLSDQFVCTADYPNQKNLTTQARQINVKGNFEFTGDLKGMDIVLIDDVITTGSTIKECVETLLNKGANKVYVVVLAVNQFKGSYWKSSNPEVNCPRCDDKMHLLVNSNTGEFFYSCYNCSSTLSYHEGKKLLLSSINTETI